MIQPASLALLISTAILAALSGAALAKPGAPADGVSSAALIAAARSTPLAAIDYGEQLCRNARTIDAWLKELTGAEARRIRWTAGRCRIVNSLTGIDAGSRWCAHAAIALRHPRDAHDEPMVEIFFERPKGGRPGAAYAFRALMDDTFRFRRDFESAWLDRFPGTADQIRCPDQ